MINTRTRVRLGIHLLSVRLFRSNGYTSRVQRDQVPCVKNTHIKVRPGRLKLRVETIRSNAQVDCFQSERHCTICLEHTIRKKCVLEYPYLNRDVGRFQREHGTSPRLLHGAQDQRLRAE